MPFHIHRVFLLRMQDSRNSVYNSKETVLYKVLYFLSAILLWKTFLEVYAAFENGELPSVKNVEDMLRSYVNDYCQDMMEQRIAEAVDPQLDFAVRIVMDSDLSDLRYLYRYGEYFSANETGVAEFMNSLSQDEIDSMARTIRSNPRL